MDILARKEEIQELIANDNIRDAVRRAMDFVKDFGDKSNLYEVIIFSNNFNQLQGLLRLSQVSFEEATRRRNQILLGILDLLDQVESNFAFNNQLNLAAAA